MKVTEDTVTFSDDEVRRERTIQLRDADPNELQFFIDKIPAPIKGKRVKYNFLKLYLVSVVE